MARRSQGRGAVAAFGMLVLFAGLVGGGVLWFLSAREANRAAEDFARAAPGCTTTLTFTDPGEYYVYEELSGVPDGVAGCSPTASEGRRFAFVINDPDGDELDVELDDTISYDLDAGAATSIGRIEIVDPGAYEISVVGNDPAVVAAIGGDPDARVPTLRNAAIAAAAVGFVVGLMLLMISGRRSRRAATFDSPLDPGWGVSEREHARRAAAADDAWPPAAPRIGGQVPVNPHDPEGRRVAQLDRPVGDGAPTPTLPGDPTPPTGIEPAASSAPDVRADTSPHRSPDESAHGSADASGSSDGTTGDAHGEVSAHEVAGGAVGAVSAREVAGDAVGGVSADHEIDDARPIATGDAASDEAGARRPEDPGAADPSPDADDDAVIDATAGDEPIADANWAPPEDGAQVPPSERTTE